MTLRIGINGFGRIGRNLFRVARDRHDIAEVVAVNDLTDAKTLAHLLRHDSVLGPFAGAVRITPSGFDVDGQEIRVLSQPDLGDLPWQSLGVDVVVECTGVHREHARAHLDQGAHTVVVSAPAHDSDLTVCIGVNQDAYDPSRHHVVSNASCTTNCLAPVALVLDDAFGIEQGVMTTVHAYTSGQRLLDGPHKDRRRARAAAMSIVPTTTGAARAVTAVLPALTGRLHGVALRVPVADVSIVDLTARLRRDATADEVNAAMREAAGGRLRGVLGVTGEELVSADFLHDTRSAVVDAPLTMALDDRMVKVMAWYDNEWAYSCRLWDVVEHIGRHW